MTDTQMLVLELGGKGYSCAQIVLLGALRYLGRENPDLVRAAAGLAQGGGCSGEICGALSGGLCLLGLHAGKGMDSELPHPEEQLLYESLVDWFRGEKGVDGKIICDAILGLQAGECPAMNPAVCGALVADVLDKSVNLLAEKGIDPTEGREIP